MQIGFFIFVGLFDLIGFNRKPTKPTKPTELSLVDF